ncbi:hypothetical protein ANCCAN_27699 [Ancylostoma caninum]|uniref:Uncharacterized protein n=1 Tax=Ancylostoma caninum TaxID=29170 RepID=A0A368F396_ANCCA|nr:hypothetical protein ANCCAN_27699 [Ancylostoma caninum]
MKIWERRKANAVVFTKRRKCGMMIAAVMIQIVRPGIVEATWRREKETIAHHQEMVAPSHAIRRISTNFLKFSNQYAHVLHPSWVLNLRIHVFICIVLRSIPSHRSDFPA